MTEGPVTPLAMFVVAGVLSFALSKRAHRAMRATIATSLGLSYLLLAAYMLRTHDSRPLPYLLASLAVFAFGFWCWGLDRKRTLPDWLPVGHLTQPRPPLL